MKQLGRFLRGIVVFFIALNSIVLQASPVEQKPQQEQGQEQKPELPNILLTDEEEINEYLMTACFMTELVTPKGEIISLKTIQKGKAVRTFIARNKHVRDLTDVKGFAVESMLLKKVFEVDLSSSIDSSHGRLKKEFDVELKLVKAAKTPGDAPKVAIVKARYCERITEY